MWFKLQYFTWQYFTLSYQKEIFNSFIHSVSHRNIHWSFRQSKQAGECLTWWWVIAYSNPARVHILSSWSLFAAATSSLKSHDKALNQLYLRVWLHGEFNFSQASETNPLKIKLAVQMLGGSALCAYWRGETWWWRCSEVSFRVRKTGGSAVQSRLTNACLRREKLSLTLEAWYFLACGRMR